MGSRAEWTEYAVPGWGVGELWTRDGVVLAHEFRFAWSTRLRHGRSLPAPTCDQIPDRRSLETSSHRLDGRFLARRRSVSLADVPLDLDWTTPFQRSVAQNLRALPRGEVVSYGELAALAGYPGAARAVGSFCAENRFMFFVPCHRVVGATGIGGYGSAGVGVKRRLLALEGVEL